MALTNENKPFTTIDGFRESNSIEFPKENSIEFPKENSIEFPKENSIEILHGEERKCELNKIQDAKIKTDFFDSKKRRILIALHAYGIDDPRIQAFLGMSRQDLLNILNTDQEIKEAIKNNEVPCWTQAEIIARMCVEAETAQRSAERITALNKLMEYRGLVAPEGGSRTFSRTVLKFKRG